MKKKNCNDCDRPNFTLTQAIPYQIKIAGLLSENWFVSSDEVNIQIETDPTGLATTTLTGRFDQAGLIGLLRQVYSMGFPLISVNCIETEKNQKEFLNE